jgi:retron-type reverse transcriptase
MPKRSNPHGIGVSVLTRHLSSVSEGGQLRFFAQENFAAISGLVLLDELVAGKLNPANNDLYSIVSDIDVLKAAYYKIKSKSASMTPGVDGKNLNDISTSEDYFVRLSKALKDESFHPKPTKRVLVPKKNGKTRPLGIPILQDRIVQQSLLFVLDALFEKNFNERSHGYRTNKGAHTTCKSIRT